MALSEALSNWKVSPALQLDMLGKALMSGFSVG